MTDAFIPPWQRDGTRGTCESLTLAARVFFSMPSPRLIALFIVLPLALRVWAGGVSPWDAAIVVGVALGWGLQEHQAHKYLLHMKPFRLFGRSRDLYMARVHREHHQEPWRLKMTMLPAAVPLIAFPFSCLLWWLAMPTLSLALTGITAYSAMALAYEWTHYLTHVPYVPRSRYYRRICKSHRWHHFKHEAYWFGFTNPFVDDLFRTAPDPSSVGKSDTVRTLGVDYEDPDAILL